jgi:hypothetical protein
MVKRYQLNYAHLEITMKRHLVLLMIGIIGICFFIVGCDEGEDRDDGVDGPPWSCHYDQDMTSDGAKGCFQYDESVSEEDARAACKVHQIGAALPLDMAENRVLRGGPCDLDMVSGFCECECYPVPGVEYLPYKELYIDDPAADCVEDGDEINSLLGCEENVGGSYTCTISD